MSIYAHLQRNGYIPLHLYHRLPVDRRPFHDLAEDVATLTIDEVVEWSAIYGKAMVEM
jgi:hypothetical protein